MKLAAAVGVYGWTAEMAERRCECMMMKVYGNGGGVVMMYGQ